MADPGAITGATISIGQAVVAYQFFLPRIGDVRKSDPSDPAMRGDVILGQVAAGALTFAIGLLLAWMTGSAVPVYAALFVAFVIASFYHLALNGKGVAA